MKVCGKARVEFYDTSITDCSWEKVDLGSNYSDTYKLEMVTFSQNILDSIGVRTVKIKSAEYKKWLELENFSNLKDYFSRSNN